MSIEALVFRAKPHRPYLHPINVDYKDDKSYPYTPIARGDVFPAN